MKKVLSKSMLVCIGFLVFTLSTEVAADRPLDDLPASLTLPKDKRPAWIRENGIVMAGNWEPFAPRVKIETGGYIPTQKMIQRYEAAHSDKVINYLRESGINFMMTHYYKGAGLAMEMPDMEYTKDFISRCKAQGIHTGVYMFSGSIMYEPMFNECPESRDWLLLDYYGYPFPWGKLDWRLMVNRNHPGQQAYLKRVIDYAVRETNVDMLHFDNFFMAQGYDKTSVARFREYLKKHYKPQYLGVDNFDNIMPPPPTVLKPEVKDVNYMTSTKSPWPQTYAWSLGEDPNSPLKKAWVRFICDSLAEAYWDLSNFARSIRPDILMECNPAGVTDYVRSAVDHGKLMRYGEALWDELNQAKWENGKLSTKIRTYRMAQSMEQIVFAYSRTVVPAAEALAFNDDCLGCVVYHLDEQITIPKEVVPYIRFFHEKRPWYRYAKRLPNIAHLRSFASEYLTNKDVSRNAYDFEDFLIRKSIPWIMIFDQHTDNLSKFEAVSLIGCDALSNQQIADVLNYAKAGGGMILTYTTGNYDENMQLREKNPLADLQGPKIVKLKPEPNGITDAVMMEAFLKAFGEQPYLSVEGPPYLLGEITEQTEQGRRLVHLVNYNESTAAIYPQIRAIIPEGWKVTRCELMTPEEPKAHEIQFRQIGDNVTFTVPFVKGYALISMETRK